MAIKVPIVSSFNNTGLVQAETSMKKFGVTNTKALKAGAAGFGLLAVAGAKAFASLDKGYDAIIVATGASGKALDELKDSAKSVASEVPNSFEEVGVAIGEVATRLGTTGAPLEAMTKKFLDLSRITKTDVTTNVRDVARVFGDAGVAAEDQAATLDMLFAATQQTGIGMDRLSTLTVNYGAPLRALGFELDESIAMLSKWEAEGVNTEAILAGMKMGLNKLAIAGKDPATAFVELSDKMKAATTDTEAISIAAEVFGSRAGADMAMAVREGRFEIDDLMASLGDTEGALDSAAEATLSANDKFKIMGNQMLVAVAPAVETIEKALSALVGVFVALPGPVRQVVVIMGVLAIAYKSAASVAAAFATKNSAANASMLRTKIAASGAAGALGVLGGVAMVGYIGNAITAKRATDRFNDSMSALGRAADEELGEKLVDAIMSTVLAGGNLKDLDAVFEKLAETSYGATTRMLEMEDASGGLTEQLLAQGGGAGDASEWIDKLRAAHAKETTAQENLAKTSDATTVALEDNTDATEDNETATKAVTDAVAEHKRKSDELITSLQTQWDKTQNLIESQLGLASSDLAYRNSAAATIPKLEAYAAALDDGKMSAFELDGVARETEGAILAQADAAVRLAEDQAAANGQTLDAKDKTKIYKDEIDRLLPYVGADSELNRRLAETSAQMGGAASAAQNAANRYNNFTAAAGRVPTAGPGSNTLAPGRAHGGPVAAGGTYLIGEQGPELLTMGSSGGNVTSNDALQRAGGTGGSTINLTVNAGMGANGTDIGNQIVAVLQKHARRNGPLNLAIQ